MQTNRKMPKLTNDDDDVFVGLDPGFIPGRNPRNPENS